MRLRKFKKNDAVKTSIVMRQSVTKSENLSKKTIKFLCDYYSPKRIVNNSKKMDIFIVHDKDKIYGTCSLLGNRISKMFVHPKYQKKGIGKKLLNHIEKLAKQRGMKRVRVRSSSNAYEFYEKLGYSKTRKVKNKNLGYIIWMKKKINE